MSRAVESMIAGMTRGQTATPLRDRIENRGGRPVRWPAIAAVPTVTAPEVVASEPATPAPDFDLIRDEARAQGEKAGLAAAQERIETLAQRYLDAIQRLDKATRNLQKPDPTEIVDLALATAGELVGHEIAVDRDVLVNTVEGALAQVEEKRGVIVRMGKTDLAYLMSRRPELVSAGYFVEDDALGIGGCVIETPQRVIDLGIERRLEAVRHSLYELFLPPEPGEVEAQPEIEELADAPVSAAHGGGQK